MMKQIGDELEDQTHALSQISDGTETVKILDLCMAPGGYTASALKYNPGATAFGITLPLAQGGHKVLLKSNSSTVLFQDITMLAKEFGFDNPPPTHPEHKSFLNERPYLEHKFHLVFCDGQVLRTHERAEYREQHEARRLTVSQLIMALQRIRPGGTMIVLLHKVESWVTAELMYHFNQFSSIQTFKPHQKHALRSSFYLVAKNVQPDADGAKSAVDSWKRSWWNATFGGEDGTGEFAAKASKDYVQTVLDDFGGKLIELGRPVWQIQANALDRKLTNEWY
jgi:23S rRNA U2552 (ribose-2'-O)-methylase RlmE/FtsJ